MVEGSGGGVVAANPRFEADKQAWEDAIRGYNGSDPLDLWFNYITWYEQNRSFDRLNNLRPIVERCLLLYQEQDGYKQDTRMIKIWIKYIDMQQSPASYYQMMYKKNIGTQCASFYIAWADRDYKQAGSIYNLGIQMKAQPIEELHEAQRNYRLYNETLAKKRTASAMVEQRLPAVTSQSPPHKKLKQEAVYHPGQSAHATHPHAGVNGGVITEVPNGTYVNHHQHHQQHGYFHPHSRAVQSGSYYSTEKPPNGTFYPANGQQEPYQLTNSFTTSAVGTSSVPAASQPVQHSAPVEERFRTLPGNTTVQQDVPQPVSDQATESEMPGSVYRAPDESIIECNLNNSAYVISSSLSYVYDDPDLVQYPEEVHPEAPEATTEQSAQVAGPPPLVTEEPSYPSDAIRLPPNFVREAKSNHETWDVPLCLEEPYDPNRRCYYPKHLVYPDLHAERPTMEFSLEEIRARRWFERKRKEQQQKEQEEEAQRQAQKIAQLEKEKQMRQLQQLKYQQQQQQQQARVYPTQEYANAAGHMATGQTVQTPAEGGASYNVQQMRQGSIQHTSNFYHQQQQQPHSPYHGYSNGYSAPNVQMQQQQQHQGYHQTNSQQHHHVHAGPPHHHQQHHSPVPTTHMHSPTPGQPYGQQHNGPHQYAQVHHSPHLHSPQPYHQHPHTQQLHVPYDGYNHHSYPSGQQQPQQQPQEAPPQRTYQNMTNVVSPYGHNSPAAPETHAPPRPSAHYAMAPQTPPNHQIYPGSPTHHNHHPHHHSHHQQQQQQPVQQVNSQLAMGGPPGRQGAVAQTYHQQSPHQYPHHYQHYNHEQQQQQQAKVQSAPVVSYGQQHGYNATGNSYANDTALSETRDVQLTMNGNPSASYMNAQGQVQMEYQRPQHTQHQQQQSHEPQQPQQPQQKHHQQQQQQQQQLLHTQTPHIINNNHGKYNTNCDDFEEQIEASTIRFSTPTENGASRKQTITIRFKKEKTGLSTSVSGANPYSPVLPSGSGADSPSPISAGEASTNINNNIPSSVPKEHPVQQQQQQQHQMPAHPATPAEEKTKKHKKHTKKSQQQDTVVREAVAEESFHVKGKSSSKAKHSKKKQSVVESEDRVRAAATTNRTDDANLLLAVSSRPEKDEDSCLSVLSQTDASSVGSKKKKKSKKSRSTGKEKRRKHRYDLDEDYRVEQDEEENEGVDRTRPILDDHYSEATVGDYAADEDDEEDDDDDDGVQDQYYEVEEEDEQEDAVEEEEEEEYYGEEETSRETTRRSRTIGSRHVEGKRIARPDEDDSSYQSNSEFNTSFSNISFAGDNSNGPFNYGGGSNCSTPIRRTQTSANGGVGGAFSKTSTPVSSFRFLRKQGTNLSNLGQNEDSMNSTVVENSFFQAGEHDEEARRRRLEKALATIETQLGRPFVDPFNGELCRAFLTKVDFPSTSRDPADNYHLSNANLPKLVKGQTTNLGGTAYNIEKEVGRGSYGSVFRAVNTQTGAVVAIKYQKPANTWELYICTEVKKRLSNLKMLPGFMDISAAVIAPNASVLVSEFSQYGSLLDINNKIRTAATRKVIQTDGFTCIEMQEGRPWSYQTDLFCVAGTIHVMLFGEYMQLVKKYDGGWDIKQKLPRYLKKHVWTEVFQKLLNIKDIDHMPSLPDLQRLINEEAYKMDSELATHIRSLSNLLKSR
uniref:BUB1 N-terminal domain-containing protein n=1 Tax=Anopheles epiroticus TaxID=199890 RepID=A0A182PUC1_9DIPT